MKYSSKCALFMVLMLCSIGTFAKASESVFTDEDKFIADSTMMMSNKFTKNWEFTGMLGAQTVQAEYSQFSPGHFKLKDSWQFTGDISLVK